MAIRGLIHIEGDTPHVFFRAGGVRIAEEIEWPVNELGQVPFRVMVPAGARGTIEVEQGDDVVARVPARAGQTDIRVRAP